VRALITGVTGMDGSHLAEFLLTKGYEVYGLKRRSALRGNTLGLQNQDNFHFVNGDMTDQASLIRAIEISKPDEVYNLAAQSFVGESWNTPVQTSDVTGIGALRLLEAIKITGCPCRIYQASSSEMFGKMESLANEETKFHPRSPYGVSKLYAHWAAINYRESYKMPISCGILFNHESERRGLEFVTRKITRGVALIHLAMEDKILLGNLDSKRDWGYAPDYVEAMWLMLQEEPDDFVIATGRVKSIRDFLDAAFKVINVDNWKPYVAQDPKFMRPLDVVWLQGDASKAKNQLGWKPKTTFEEMVERMVLNDIAHLSNS
jgi:GDPmannose 4,6-dehydratase